jgi:2-amino-4-hydroxy-6-hydroxymethyldihydropteridine diphosphokinase
LAFAVAKTATLMRTAVALGSNLGGRLSNLRAAYEAIIDLPDVTSPILASAIYETSPVDCEPGAGKFLNAVVEFGYEGDPLDLMRELRQIENALGRPLDHPRNISREIDIDVLYFGDRKIDSQELKLPHPRMRDREFVLRPLADIRAELILPGQLTTVGDLLAQLPKSDRASRIAETLN